MRTSWIICGDDVFRREGWVEVSSLGVLAGGMKKRERNVGENRAYVLDGRAGSQVCTWVTVLTHFGRVRKFCLSGWLIESRECLTLTHDLV